MKNDQKNNPFLNPELQNLQNHLRRNFLTKIYGLGQDIYLIKT